MDGARKEAELQAFRDETEQRLARLSPDKTIKGFYLRGYLDAYRSEGGEALEQRCRALIPDKDLVDFFSYPYALVMQMGLLGAEALVPKFGGVVPYLRAMGRVAVNQYLGSAVGRTFLGLAQPSPRSMLRMLPTAISTTIRFGTRSVQFSDDQHCVFSCRDDFSPAEANAGAIEAVIVAAKGKAPRVEVRALSLLDYDIEAAWS